MNSPREHINFISHLNAVYELFDADERITVYHVVLYLALFRIWNMSLFRNPITVNRTELMSLSKIGSTKTYAKIMNDLNKWGYVKYAPSKANLLSSKIHMFTSCSISEHVVPHLYKHINNKTNIYIGQKSLFDVLEEYDQQSSLQNITPPCPKTDSSDSATKTCTIPSLGQLKIYFNNKGIAEIEAEKFYNYYESLGWCTSAGNQIADWKAKARNWILNLPRFSSKFKSGALSREGAGDSENKAGNSQNYGLNHGVTNLETDKDYDIPL